MLEIELLSNILQQKQLAVAMVAPSFPIMFSYPQIIGKLKRLGFAAVVEVAAGAMKTNDTLYKVFKDDPRARYITSPCPSFVRLVRKKYPKLLPYVTTNIDSPMAATARILRERYPGYRPVFIGPCFAKKMEAKEEHVDLDIIVITFVELETLFQTFAVGSDARDAQEKFDIESPHTRMYPTDGGLTDSSGLRGILHDDEIRVVSGWKNCEPALAEFATNPTIRLLDILFCDGGCISGPGIASPLTTTERKKKIEAFARP